MLQRRTRPSSGDGNRGLSTAAAMWLSYFSNLLAAEQRDMVARYGSGHSNEQAKVRVELYKDR